MTVVAISAADFARRKERSDVLLVNQLSRAAGCNPDHLRGPLRFQEYVAGRKKVATELRALGWSYPRIGRALGGKDHTSIMYLVGAIRRPAKRTQEAPNAR